MATSFSDEPYSQIQPRLSLRNSTQTLVQIYNVHCLGVGKLCDIGVPLTGGRTRM